MAFRTTSVAVEQLPAIVDGRSERRFFREMEASMNVERPAIVLDCSALREIDSSAMHLLLCCLEGAMKRNGDVRLGGVCVRARLTLQLAGMDHLFRIFATAEEAVASFQRHIVVMPQSAELQLVSEPAA